MRRPRALTEEERDKIWKLHLQGIESCFIAERLDRCPRFVSDEIREHRLQLEAAGETYRIAPSPWEFKLSNYDQMASGPVTPSVHIDF